MTTICDLDLVVATELSSAVGEAAVVDEPRGPAPAPGRQTPPRTPSSSGRRSTSPPPSGSPRRCGSARPSLGVVLVRRRIDSGLLSEALRAGCARSSRSATSPACTPPCGTARGSPPRCGSSRRSSAAGPGRPKGRVVTVFSAKGGCGKTTVATNLAAALADRRPARRSCLVDLDLAFGDVAIALQLFPAHTIADAVPLGDDARRAGAAAAADAAQPRAARRWWPRSSPARPRPIPAELVARILRRAARALRLRRHRHPAGLRRPRARGVRPQPT